MYELIAQLSMYTLVFWIFFILLVSPILLVITVIVSVLGLIILAISAIMCIAVLFVLSSPVLYLLFKKKLYWNRVTAKRSRRAYTNVYNS